VRAWLCTKKPAPKSKRASASAPDWLPPTPYAAARTSRCWRVFLTLRQASARMKIMSTITFDTHKFIQELKTADFTEKQAEAVANAFKTAQGEAELATKRDVERLESKMETRFAEQKAETIKWMVGLAMAQMALLIGILLKLP